jgi:transcriptional regulator with XRE-family HTH domain
MLSSNFLLSHAPMLTSMAKKSINQVFAENLAALMERRGVNQTALSKKSGVSQKTISNYLNPTQRSDGAKGKEPSAKLTELAMIGDALQVDSWQLLRPLNPQERNAYEAIEAAFKALQPTLPSPAAPTLVASNKAPKTANSRHS